jgi:hypothetical protein
MTETKFTKVKDFNPELLKEEVNALSPPFPAREIWHAGFDPSTTSRDQVVPIAGATKQVGRNGDVIDTAVKGEIRVTTRNPLTAAQNAAIDGAFDAHVATGKSANQLEQERIQADLAALRARLPSITDPDLQLTASLTLDLGADVFSG